MASSANGAQGPRIPWRLIRWVVPVVLLTIPWLARLPWTASDFIFAGAMFAIVGGIFELTVRASGNTWYRGGVAAALGTAFLLVWINGAVGFIGDENNPANLIFFVVITIAISGAIVARFEAAAMARAMTVAGGAQVLVALLTLIMGLGAGEPPGLAGVVVLILVFAGLWFFSGFCFRKAAAAQAKVL